MPLYGDLISFLAPLIGGGIILATASSKSKKLAALKENGLPAEGIVFKMEQESGGIKFNLTGNSQDWGSNNKYPVVRFLTAEKEWITAHLFNHY